MNETQRAHPSLTLTILVSFLAGVFLSACEIQPAVLTPVAQVLVALAQTSPQAQPAAAQNPAAQSTAAPAATLAQAGTQFSTPAHTVPPPKIPPTLLATARPAATRQASTPKAATPTAVRPTATKPAAPKGVASGGWYQIYFTAPQYPDQAETRVRDIEDALIAAINSAKSTLDIAIFQLNLEDVGEALLAAKKRGVKVRMVTDIDSLVELETLRSLKKAGVSIISDNREPIMHNKFMVVDGKAVWTGSYNWTPSCTFRNNNNAIYIQSPELAADYRVEFEKMYVDKQFGGDRPADIPYPEITINGTRIQVCFAPEGNCSQKIIAAISSAQKSVQFMAFSFTHDGISKAVEERLKNGVKISGVFETRGTDTEASEYERLLKRKADVLLDGNPYNMHHKVFIIDGKIVILGSYNFSRNADTLNDENLLIIHNADIAKTYLEEYRRVYAQAENPVKE